MGKRAAKILAARTRRKALGIATGVTDEGDTGPMAPLKISSSYTKPPPRFRVSIRERLACVADQGHIGLA